MVTAVLQHVCKSRCGMSEAGRGVVWRRPFLCLCGNPVLLCCGGQAQGRPEVVQMVSPEMLWMLKVQCLNKETTMHLQLWPHQPLHSQLSKCIWTQPRLSFSIIRVLHGQEWFSFWFSSAGIEPSISRMLSQHSTTELCANSTEASRKVAFSKLVSESELYQELWRVIQL